MTITKTQNGGTMTVSVAGRLDTTTAPDLEKEFSQALPALQELTIDLKDLDYISSAGLRVLLSAHKTMARKGGMKIINVNDLVMEVFDVTGFVDILNIE